MTKDIPDAAGEYTDPRNHGYLQRSGRTTAFHLQAIADALLKPDRWIEVVDFEECPDIVLPAMKHHLESLVERIGLEMEVTVVENRLYVLSAFKRLRNRRSGV